MCFVSGKSLTMQTWQQIVFLSFNGKRLNHPISPSPHLPWIHTTEQCQCSLVLSVGRKNTCRQPWLILASILIRDFILCWVLTSLFVFERWLHVMSHHVTFIYSFFKLALQLPLKIKETDRHANIWNMDNKHKGSENKEQTMQRQATARQNGSWCSNVQLWNDKKQVW